MNANEKSLVILEAAWAKIADKANWCRGAYAMTAERQRVDSDDPDAVQWCAIGAIGAVANTVLPDAIIGRSDAAGRAYLALNDAAKEITGTAPHGVADVNDSGDYDGHADVMRMYGIAMNSLRD